MSMGVNDCKVLRVQVKVLIYLDFDKSRIMLATVGWLPKSSKRAFTSPGWWKRGHCVVEYTQGSLQKRLILELRQEVPRLSLEHLVLPKSKELLKASKRTEKAACMAGGVSEGHRSQLENSLWWMLEQHKQQSQLYWITAQIWNKYAWVQTDMNK